MKHLLPLILLITSCYIISCANQGTPTGGVMDTIPPILLNSYPETKSINYKAKTFKFEFNEKINADKVNSQLIITPHTENKFKVTYKKYNMEMEFEENFEDSTTYTLNFAEGVVDVTEKNSVENFKLAFSTGPFIDSIYVTGKITDLYENINAEEYLVALYLITDTLDIFEDKPRYFANTNKQGQFIIENIKNDHYKIVAFKDENKNLTLNPDTENHGFFSKPLDLNTSKDSIRLTTQLINASKFKFIRSKNTGLYFDVQYNKSVVEYDIERLDSTSALSIPPYNKIKQNTFIRFYPHQDFKLDIDSLAIIIHAYDTLQNQSVDTVHIKFKTSNRKPEKFTASIAPGNNSKIDTQVEHIITFSKPIGAYHLDSIQFAYDTLMYQSITDSTATWNSTNTALTFQTLLDSKYLTNEVDTLLSIYGDTTRTDSISMAKASYLSQINTKQTTLLIPASTFISIEGDSSNNLTNEYKFKSIEDLGSVSGILITEHQSFSVQLVTEGFKVVAESKNTKTFNFPHVKPGKYTFRIMIDNDTDGTWSFGNILQNREPETVFFYPEVFDVRANWELENIEISF